MLLSKAWETYESDKRIEGFSPQTHLLNNGAPLDVIQSLLGHEKSETTKIYAQLSGSLKYKIH
ncbi:hypothetical protein EPB69_04330 [Geobacillus stearothermophilus]|nr:hypothetical protein EPB69_04330 [Geobacillus stearothermophilus]